MDKPKVLLLVDKPNWAFDIAAKQLVPLLAPWFECSINYVINKPTIRPDEFDLIHVFFWGEQSYKNYFDPKQSVLSKEVTSHRWENDPRFIVPGPKEFVEKYLQDATIVTVTSRRLENKLSPYREVFYVPNGFNESIFFNRNKRIGPIRIGWAGNKKDNCKGINDILIPAAEGHIDLLIAGGEVAPEQMADFYNDIDVLCIASTAEGEPLTLIESMACGCFPLSVDVGIVPELVTHRENGLIVERSVPAFRDAFTWCQENQEFIRRNGILNAKKILENRTWTHVAPLWRKAFETALSRSPKRVNSSRIDKETNASFLHLKPRVEITPFLHNGISEMNNTFDSQVLGNHQTQTQEISTPTPIDNAAIKARCADDGTLSNDEWFHSIVGSSRPQDMAKDVLAGKIPVWTQELLDYTAPGQRLLELGSGTGKMSAYLASQGRNTTLFDFSSKILAFSKQLYECAGVCGEFVEGDILKPLPFADRSFDLVWSSGVLEHWTDDQIVEVLKESARVSCGKVISFVPNAYSIAYRLGKHCQEQCGEWKWGHEDPRHSQRKLFQSAGMKVAGEYSVAPEHSVKFLTMPGAEPIREAYLNWMASLSKEEKQKLHQGYLLVTVGEVI